MELLRSDSIRVALKPTDPTACVGPAEPAAPSYTRRARRAVLFTRARGKDLLLWRALQLLRRHLAPGVRVSARAARVRASRPGAARNDASASSARLACAGMLAACQRTSSTRPSCSNSSIEP